MGKFDLQKSEYLDKVDDDVTTYEYITTYKGENFTPLNPDPLQIHIEDIAHSLSLMCRANGHIDYFFSVAQHSINCATEAKARGYAANLQLACLIHDASEAYISDITRPVKQFLSEYKKIEKRLQDTIYERFLGYTLAETETASIDSIDNDMLLNEFAVLMKNKKLFTSIPKLSSKPSFEYRNPAEIETEFLKLYYGIMHAVIIQGR